MTTRQKGSSSIAQKRVKLVLPAGLIVALQYRAKAEAESMSSLVSNLLKADSAPTTLQQVNAWSEVKSVTVMLPESVVRRLRRLAKKKGLSLSGLVSIHLERELWVGLAPLDERIPIG